MNGLYYWPVRRKKMSENTQIQAIEEEYSGELEEIDVDQPCPVVESDEAVITTLGRLIYRDKAIEKIKQQADFIVSNAQLWAMREVAKIEKQKEWFLTPLQSFMESINKSNPKIKSLKFPVGRIGLRQSPQTIAIDPDFVSADHKDDPNVTEKTTYSVSKKSVKKQLDDTGEIPDYASVVPGETKFYYKGE